VSAAQPQRLVFVTGGSSGIGRALLDTVPWPSAQLWNLSRHPTPGARHVAVDLAEPGGWQRAEETFAGALGGVASGCAVLIHAAGTLTPIRFAGETDAASYRRNVLLNTAAPQVLGDAFLRTLRGAGPDLRGWMLFVGSGASTRVYEGWSGYGAGKAAVDHWTRIVGAEQHLRGDRCRVLCVAPGVVETAMQAEIRETRPEDFPQVDRFRALHEEGALRHPHDVARQLWSLLDRELANGAVLDLRDA
jgi:benzil reductase ((S)-benzoin forming)